ncbi:MAG: hypothetical protein Q4E99_06370, partial [Bacillota bacterium]|nr:hypothetical protein [Bacillota bacterium]
SDIMSTIINTDPESIIKQNSALLTQNTIAYEGQKNAADQERNSLQNIIDDEVATRTNYREQIKKLQDEITVEEARIAEDRGKLNKELEEATENRYWSKASEIKNTLDTYDTSLLAKLNSELQVLTGREKENQKNINSNIAAQNSISNPQEQLSENEKSELSLLSTIAEKSQHYLHSRNIR